MSSTQNSSSNRTRGRGIFTNELVNSDSDENNNTTPRPRPLSGGMRRATVSIGEFINPDGLSQTTPGGYDGAVRRRPDNMDRITASSNDQTNPNSSRTVPPVSGQLPQMADLSLQHNLPWSTTYLGVGGSANTAQSVCPHSLSSFNNTGPGVGSSSSNVTQAFIPNQQVFIPNQQVFIPNQQVFIPYQQVAPFGINRRRAPNHAALERYHMRHHGHRRRTGHGRWRIDGVQIAARHVQRREANYMPWASIDSGRRRHSWNVNSHYPYTHGRNHPNPDLGVGYPWKKDWEHVVTNEVMDGVDCPHEDNVHRIDNLTAPLGVRGLTDQPGYSFDWWQDGLWEPPDDEADNGNENANEDVAANENQNQNENANDGVGETENQNQNENENGSGMNAPIAEGEEADGHVNEDINME